MKFSLFAHMEKTSPSQSYKDLHDEFLSICKLAEDGGMHAIWTGEHHCMDFTIAPNPFITIVDLANKLKSIRLGTGTVIAPFWHPIKLAGEAAMTDVGITGGGNGSNMLYLSGVQKEKVLSNNLINKVIEEVEKKALEIENNQK